jgi:hypothetical protein
VRKDLVCASQSRIKLVCLARDDCLVARRLDALFSQSRQRHWVPAAGIPQSDSRHPGVNVLLASKT